MSSHHIDDDARMRSALCSGQVSPYHSNIRLHLQLAAPDLPRQLEQSRETLWMDQLVMVRSKLDVLAACRVAASRDNMGLIRN